MTQHMILLARTFLLIVIASTACENDTVPSPGTGDVPFSSDFPPFITPVEDFFQISLGDPIIHAEDYSLKISGAVDSSLELSLEDLMSLPMVEKAVTVECIENRANGSLVATARWKGFRVYDLLESCGIKDEHATIRYKCADGYHTYNTLEEIRTQDVIAALFMNGEVLPPDFGFPLRIIFPGYFGVRHPGWIVEMEVLEGPVADFWMERGWATDSSMIIDSQIFFPAAGSSAGLGDTVKVGGSAFGAQHIASVEITVDGGQSWIPALLRDSLEEEFAWVFWEAEFVPVKEGNISIRARARDGEGRLQPESDPSYLDGTNTQPQINLEITK